MSARSEACRIAKEMSEKYGGKPADYMGKAWRIVKERMESPEYFDDPDDYDSRSYKGRKITRTLTKKGQHLTKRLAVGAWENLKRGTKRSIEDTNMLKAPKDSPKEVFGDLRGYIAKRPDTPEIPQSVKNIFKFW